MGLMVLTTRHRMTPVLSAAASVADVGSGSCSTSSIHLRACRSRVGLYLSCAFVNRSSSSDDTDASDGLAVCMRGCATGTGMGQCEPMHPAWCVRAPTRMCTETRLPPGVHGVVGDKRPEAEDGVLGTTGELTLEVAPADAPGPVGGDRDGTAVVTDGTLAVRMADPMCPGPLDRRGEVGVPPVRDCERVVVASVDVGVTVPKTAAASATLSDRSGVASVPDSAGATAGGEGPFPLAELSDRARLVLAPGVAVAVGDVADAVKEATRELTLGARPGAGSFETCAGACAPFEGVARVHSGAGTGRADVDKTAARVHLGSGAGAAAAATAAVAAGAAARAGDEDGAAGRPASATG